MRTQDITTTNLSEFGHREREEMNDLLNAWSQKGLPDEFCDDEVTCMFNKMSGCVFLTNSEYQTAMINGDKLEMWHNCSNCGHEGFAEDCQLNDEGCNVCNEIEEDDEEEI